MQINNGNSFLVKGIVHCHTDHSYDGRISLKDLCKLLKKEGFHFVAVTEHTDGLSRDDYVQFVEDCRRESDDNFVAIPGIEVRCRDKREIAGIGVTDLIEHGTPEDTIDRIRKLGGYTVWLHPLKHGKFNRQLLDCDAVEVLNGKTDETVAPNLSLLRAVRKMRKKGEIVCSIFGADLHGFEDSRGAWIECMVPNLSSDAIIECLKSGEFSNHVMNGVVAGTGDIKISNYLRFICLRFAFIWWNRFLKIAPDVYRIPIIRLTRPLIGLIKRAK